MKKVENILRTILSAFVIFQLSIATSATPIVALAFEGEALATSSEEVISETTEESAPVNEEVEVSNTDTEEGVLVETETSSEETSEVSTETNSPVETEEATTSDTGEVIPTTEETTPNTGETLPVVMEEQAPLPLKAEAQTPAPVCDISGSILVNGGFENPAVENYAWNIYETIPGWTVSWMPASGNGSVANFELQRGLWNAYEANQYIELDSDFDGPDGSISGEAGSTIISQEIATVPGVTYTVKFAFAGRPGTSIEENGLQFYVDGVEWGAPLWMGNLNGTQPNWTVFTKTFTAVKTSTVISFADVGISNSVGTFLDDVSITCDDDGKDDPKECPAGQIYARIKFAKVASGAAVNGWRNWGNGDVSPLVYVGGDQPMHKYADEEWFPLTNPDGTFINDPDISSYRDVPGVAVQRMEGKIRVVLYGFHLVQAPGANKGETILIYDGISKEMAYGVLEISNNATFENMQSPYDFGNSNSNPRLHDPYVNDSENPMDSRDGHVGYINQYNNRFDRMKTLTDQKVSFHFVVDSGSDGMYAHYDYEKVEDCDGEQNFPPEITVWPTEVTVTVGGFYDIMEGVTADDLEDGDITSSLVSSGTVDFNTIGSYQICYDVTDSDGNSAVQKCRIINVVEDNDGGDGDGENPNLAVPGEVCIEESVVDYDFTKGVTATDLEDGNLTSAVTNDSSTSVVLGTIGDYTVTYFVTDSDSNTNSTTRKVFVRDDCSNDDGGDGDEENPSLSFTDLCILSSVTSFDFNTGVTVTDDEGAEQVLVSNNGEFVVVFGTEGSYSVIYIASDSDGNSVPFLRTITIDDTCGNNGGDEDDNDDNDNSSSSSSSGSRGRRAGGEVLGANVGPACIRFNDYYDTGDVGGEISALQTFLNDYMDAKLKVDGVYGIATTQAVHNFQALHWNDIIDPWNPPLSPNTTGRFYKTTRATVNALIECPEQVVFLEDPKIDYTVTSVANAKEFSKDATVLALQSNNSFFAGTDTSNSGQVLGESTENTEESK